MEEGRALFEHRKAKEDMQKIDDEINSLLSQFPELLRGTLRASPSADPSVVNCYASVWRKQIRCDGQTFNSVSKARQYAEQRGKRIWKIKKDPS